MGRVPTTKSSPRRDQTPYSMPPAVEENERPQLVCKWPVCGATAQTAKLLQRHHEIHELKSRQCRKCNGWYARKDALDRHQYSANGYCKGIDADGSNSTRLGHRVFWEILLELGEADAKGYEKEAKECGITIWSGVEPGVSYGAPAPTPFYVQPDQKGTHTTVKTVKVKVTRPRAPAPRRVILPSTPCPLIASEAGPSSSPLTTPPSSIPRVTPKKRVVRRVLRPKARIIESEDDSDGDIDDYLPVIKHKTLFNRKPIRRTTKRRAPTPDEDDEDDADDDIKSSDVESISSESRTVTPEPEPQQGPQLCANSPLRLNYRYDDMQGYFSQFPWMVPFNPCPPAVYQISDERMTLDFPRFH